MKRWNFQRIRDGVEMAQDVAVHAADFDAAFIQAHKLNHTPPGEKLRLMSNDPCPPAQHCPICEENANEIARATTMFATTADLREKALALLDAMLKARPALDALNDAAHKIYGDFGPCLPMMPDAVQAAVVELLDMPLEGNASYMLYGCAIGAGAVTVNGKTWRLANVDDLRTFLEESRTA